MNATKGGDYPMYEEAAHNMTFEHRRIELLEGQVKALKHRVETLEKQVKAINGAKLGPIINQCG